MVADDKYTIIAERLIQIDLDIPNIHRGNVLYYVSRYMVRYSLGSWNAKTVDQSCSFIQTIAMHVRCVAIPCMQDL